MNFWVVAALLAIFAVILFAMLVVAKRADEQAEQMYKQWTEFHKKKG